MEGTPMQRTERPCTHTVMPANRFDYSPTDSDLLRESVAEITKALLNQGKKQYSYGIEQLYLQSFKDPGSADLLVAVLRGRVTIKQAIDFQMYVDCVNSLRQPSDEVTTLDNLTDGVSHGRREHRVGCDKPTASEQGSPIQHSPLLETDVAHPVSCEDVRRERHQRNTERPGLPQWKKTAIHSLRESKSLLRRNAQPSRKTEVRKRRKRTRRLQKVIYSSSAEIIDISNPTPRQQETIEPEMNHQQKLAEVLLERLTDDGPEQDRPKQSAWPFIVGNEFPVKRVFQGSTAAWKRRRPKKNKMFSGANGPVYSVSFGGAPLYEVTLSGGYGH